jgi:hypothetical protein
LKKVKFYRKIKEKTIFVALWVGINIKKSFFAVEGNKIIFNFFSWFQQGWELRNSHMRDKKFNLGGDT